MATINNSASGDNRAALLFRQLERLPDEDFENFVRAERKRRRQAAWLFQQERNRWSYRRGLTRNDQIKIMRAVKPSWRERP
jgi:hypothetical protein